EMIGMAVIANIARLEIEARGARSSMAVALGVTERQARFGDCPNGAIPRLTGPPTGVKVRAGGALARHESIAEAISNLGATNANQAPITPQMSKYAIALL